VIYTEIVANRVSNVIEVTEIFKIWLQDQVNWANWIMQMMHVTFNKTDFVYPPAINSGD